MRRRHGPLYRLGPRYRHFARFERAVYGRESETEIMYLSAVEKAQFIRHYGTAERRFHFLPPGVVQSRRAPENAAELRASFRSQWRLEPDGLALVMVGSDYHRKGVDRAIRSAAALPAGLRVRTRLFVIGKGKARGYRRLAHRLGVDERVHFLGGRDDVPAFLLGARRGHVTFPAF